MSFYFYIFVASFFMACLTSPLAVITSWFRLPWLSETLAHAAMLGVAVSLVFSISPLFALLLVSISLALFVYLFSQKKQEDIGQILAVLSHGCLALGVIVALSVSSSVNLEAWLFGQILAISSMDIIWLALLALLSWAFLLIYWKPILLTAMHEDLAQIEGVDVHKIKLIIFILLAFVISFIIQYVGILLVASLLVFPASISCIYKLSPKNFVICTTCVTLIATLIGDIMAIAFNWPFGPSIVVLMFFLWLLSWGFVHYILKNVLFQKLVLNLRLNRRYLQDHNECEGEDM